MATAHERGTLTGSVAIGYPARKSIIQRER